MVSQDDKENSMVLTKAGSQPCQELWGSYVGTVVGNQQTVQELGDIVRAQDSTVVYLAETWLDETRLIGIRDKLRLGH